MANLLWATTFPDLPVDNTEVWTKTADELLGVDDDHSPSVRRAKLARLRNSTAGPGWGFMPRGPDYRKDPKIRADLQMLATRDQWDPKRKYKSIGWQKRGTTVKSPYRVAYPEYFQIGEEVCDKPSQRPPAWFRELSLSEQLLTDPVIRDNLRKRYLKRVEALGGRMPTKAEIAAGKVVPKLPRKKLPRAERRETSMRQAYDQLTIDQDIEDKIKEYEEINGPDPLAQLTLYPSSTGAPPDPNRKRSLQERSHPSYKPPALPGSQKTKFSKKKKQKQIGF